MQKMPLTSQQTNHGVGSEDADLESVLQALTAIRAEITDAAMGRRAECVMLNKGPHVLSAVRVLDDILRRMQAHQTKKRAMLRELHLAHTPPPVPSTATGAPD